MIIMENHTLGACEMSTCVQLLIDVLTVHKDYKK